ncbi:MAG: DUF333 domain-containing protein [Anaerolineae bacterium]
MNKKLTGALGLIVVMMVLLVLAACSPAESESGLANPASVNCEDQGGRLEMRQDKDGGQYGVCIFEDGSECEEWAFFRDECAPGETTISWERAADLIRNGLVDAVSQTHALEVTLNLKDGRSLTTIEPQIDDVFQVINECGEPCSNMIIATE